MGPGGLLKGKLARYGRDPEFCHGSLSELYIHFLKKLSNWQMREAAQRASMRLGSTFRVWS